MATNSRGRRVFTPEERQDYIERFNRSGLSQVDFCRRVNIHPVTFSIWKGRAKAAVLPVFAEVQVSGPASARDGSGGAAVLHLPGGARMEVAIGGDAAWRGLGMMLKSLQC